MISMVKQMIGYGNVSMSVIVHFLLIKVDEDDGDEDTQHQFANSKYYGLSIHANTKVRRSKRVTKNGS